MHIKKIRNNKGLFFTLAIVLILVPLILLVSFQTNTSKTKMVDTNSKIRCDELHYFVEDVKKDLSRAGTIFGRRAAIYAIDYVVEEPGNPLENYSFNCSEVCGVDCSRITYPRNGSEAAIAELALCGTLNGTNVTYMVNHTIKEWVNRIEMRGAEKNFRIKMSLREIKVIPIDSWNFSTIVDHEVSVTDETGICYYMGANFQTMSNTSIIGLEDPLYTLGSSGLIIKYIYDCEPNISSTPLVAGATNGDRNTSGTVIRYSNPLLGSSANLEDYCNNTLESELAETILVMDSGSTVACTQKLANCTNISSTKHFAGIINEDSNNLDCVFDIPYLSNTGVLVVSDDECIYIKNNGSNHEAILGCATSGINYSCYQASNITNHVSGCGVNYGSGPSFLDRLDGRTNLSDEYVNQSMEIFNNSVIGMETLIDLEDLIDHSIIPYWNATRVDYLYWQNESGENACNICNGTDRPFRIDCPHAKRYGIDIGC